MRFLKSLFTLVAIPCFLLQISETKATFSLEDDDGKRIVSLHQNVAARLKASVQTTLEECKTVESGFSSEGLSSLKACLEQDQFPVGFHFLAITEAINQQISNFSSPKAMKHYGEAGCDAVMTSLSFRVHDLSQTHDYIVTAHHGALVHDLSSNLNAQNKMIRELLTFLQKNWVLEFAARNYLSKMTRRQQVPLLDPVD